MLTEENEKMTDTIDEAILKLKADAANVAFTGYVTNAYVEHPSSLIGEIWRHVGADEFGKFADGHCIETSAIAQIHTRGKSLWVITESGSTYGILSFTPLGWTYFSHLYLIQNRLDPMAAGIPNFYMPSPTESHAGLGRAFLKRAKNVPAKNNPKILTRSLRGPEPDLDYIQRMSAHAQETRETLRRNGVKTIDHEK
jgi:hypothetical protein